MRLCIEKYKRRHTARSLARTTKTKRLRLPGVWLLSPVFRIPRAQLSLHRPCAPATANSISVELHAPTPSSPPDQASSHPHLPLQRLYLPPGPVLRWYKQRYSPLAWRTAPLRICCLRARRQTSESRGARQRGRSHRVRAPSPSSRMTA